MRVKAVSIRQRPSGTVSVGPGGTCIRYRPPDVFVPPIMDRFDYQIEDERGRLATATVNITSVYCSARTPLDTVSGLDLCPQEPKVHVPPAVPPGSEVAAAPPSASRSTQDCGAHELVEFDGALMERESAESLAAQKCSLRTGWGDCSNENRSMAETYARKERNEPCPAGEYRFERVGAEPEYLNRYFCAQDEGSARLQTGGAAFRAVIAGASTEGTGGGVSPRPGPPADRDRASAQPHRRVVRQPRVKRHRRSAQCRARVRARPPGTDRRRRRR